MKPYPEVIEQAMQQFYQTLNEKDKRCYAAIEAQKLGHGGISYIASVLDCSRTTIYAGLAELAEPAAARGAGPAIRRPGGGRKAYSETHARIDEAFLAVIDNHLAGDPMDEQIRWTNLSQAAIQARLAEQQAIEVSTTVIKQLLAKHKLRRRKGQKNAR
jgi:hypothetical protein